MEFQTSLLGSGAIPKAVPLLGSHRTWRLKKENNNNKAINKGPQLINIDILPAVVHNSALNYT